MHRASPVQSYLNILNSPRGTAGRFTRFMVRSLSTLLMDAGYSTARKAIWDRVRKRQAISDATACLKSLLPSEVSFNAQTVQAHFDELARCDPLRESVERYKDVIGKDFQAKLSGVVVAGNLFCYVATRILKPDTVVETGCASGWTSALFLLALHHNRKGHLFSIDLPPVAGQLGMDWTMPENLRSGFLVPQELRGRWTLILGNARTELMPLLEKIRSVDVFYHDSDHTYQHMMWEYTSAWPYLSDKGLLISDDIAANTAFWDFATATGRTIVVHKSNANFGAMAKSLSR